MAVFFYAVNLRFRLFDDGLELVPIGDVFLLLGAGKNLLEVRKCSPAVHPK